MPLASLADRGNRLKAFVEGNRIKPRSSAPIPDRQYDENSESSPAPTENGARAKSAGVVSGNGIGAEQVQSALGIRMEIDGQPANGKFLDTQARERELDRLQHLFAGSELGENFMNSEFTAQEAPPSVHEEVEQRLVWQQAGTNPPPPRRPARLAAPLGTNQSAYTSSHNANPAPQSRYHSEMKDGFSRTAIPGHGKRNGNEAARIHKDIVSHDQHKAMREVRVSRSRHAHGADGRGTTKRRSRDGQAKGKDRYTISSFPDVSESDAMSDSYGLLGELELTPRGRRTERPHRHGYPDVSPSVTMRNGVRDRKRRRASPDYDDKALSGMNYAELRHQPFDFDPSTAMVRDATPDVIDRGSTKIEQFQHLGAAEQQKLFANMSMEEWEETGDWFVDKFTDIMQRLRANRKAKRETIERFENEASQREEMVRKQSDDVEQKLRKMKEDGLKVIGAKRRSK